MRPTNGAIVTTVISVTIHFVVVCFIVSFTLGLIVRRGERALLCCKADIFIS